MLNCDGGCRWCNCCYLCVMLCDRIKNIGGLIDCNEVNDWMIS